MSTTERSFQKIHEQIKIGEVKKGHNSESRTDEALEWLRSREKITCWWPGHWQQDREGVDRMVQLTNGEERPLQIKSSQTGLEKAVKNHPEIPCVVAKEKLSVEELAWHVLSALTKPLHNTQKY